MSKNKTIQIYEQTIRIQPDDYISLTDIARYKKTDRTDDLIRNWLRNRNTVEYLGIWEQLNNADFKPVEFDGFKKEAGLLVSLANLENLNAVFIEEGFEQPERLNRLNRIAISQMQILLENKVVGRLGDE